MTLKIRILLRVNNYNLGIISNFKLVEDFFKNGCRISCILMLLLLLSLDKNDDNNNNNQCI